MDGNDTSPNLSSSDDENSASSTEDAKDNRTKAETIFIDVDVNKDNSESSSESEQDNDGSDDEEMKEEVMEIPDEPECLLECDGEEKTDEADMGEGCSTSSSTEDDHKIFFEDLKTQKNKYSGSLEHVCQFCDYATARRDHLRRHMFRHTKKNNAMFKCESCDYETPRKDHLKKHAVKHKAPHEIVKLKCPYCTYEIVRTDHMKNHIMSKHLDECQIFDCDICSFQSPHEDIFKRHLLRHSGGIGDLKCPAEGCSYVTTVKKHLSRHVGRMHNSLKENLKSKAKTNSPKSTKNPPIKVKITVPKNVAKPKKKSKS